MVRRNGSQLCRRRLGCRRGAKQLAAACRPGLPLSDQCA